MPAFQKRAFVSEKSCSAMAFPVDPRGTKIALVCVRVRARVRVRVCVRGPGRFL